MADIWNKYAFVDESGDNGLDFSKAGTTKFYVVSAVILDADEVSLEEQTLKDIRERYFRTGQMKSSKVGDRHQRRKQILVELNSLRFRMFSVIIDKRRLNPETGFQWKKSFIKFMHRILDAQLYQVYDNLKIVCDRVGTKTFMQEFKKYIYRHHPPDLFTGVSFEFVRAKDNVLVQLADFIAGTIHKAIDPDVTDFNYTDVRELLSKHILGIRRWPPPTESHEYHFDSENSDEYSEAIAKYAVKAAALFMDKNSKSNEPTIHAQMNCLECLLSEIEIGDPFRYISSGELIDNMVHSPDGQMSPEAFRTNVIAELRSAEVLIASSNRGYKLPTCLQDCFDFVEKSHTTISPLLHRIEIFREKIQMVTDNRVDILSPDKFHLLRAALEGDANSDSE